MSLFDKDFDLDMTLEAAELESILEAKEEECEEKEEEAKAEKADDAEEAEDGEEEASEEDRKEAEEAAEFDLECDSLMECQGSPAIADAEEELHFITTEAMAMNIAFNRVDIACTEAYVMEADEAAKEGIIKRFKDSVKKYWERFKAFLGKLKNMVIRTAQRVAAYVRTFVAKVVAKASLKLKEKSVLEKKVNLADLKITINANLNDSVANMISRLDRAYDPVSLKFSKMASEATAEDKDALMQVKVADKAEVLKEIMGEKKEVAVAAIASDAQKLVADMKRAEELIKLVDNKKKNVLEAIKHCEARAKAMKDLDTTVMSVRMAAINKAVSVYNRELSCMTTILVAWLGARTKAFWKIVTADAVKESASDTMLEDFLKMI